MQIWINAEYNIIICDRFDFWSPIPTVGNQKIRNHICVIWILLIPTAALAILLGISFAVITVIQWEKLDNI